MHVQGGPQVGRIAGADDFSKDELECLSKALKLQVARAKLCECKRMRAPDGVAVPMKRQAEQQLDVELVPDFAAKLQNISDRQSRFVTHVGPRKTIDKLHLQLPVQEERDRWLAHARVDATVGGCAASLESVKCFQSFAEKVLRKHAPLLPPTLDELLAWSVVFRCDETFSNYLGYVKVGSMLVGGDPAVFEDKTLRRAKKAIKRRGGPKKRKKCFCNLMSSGTSLSIVFLWVLMSAGLCYSWPRTSSY